MKNVLLPLLGIFMLFGLSGCEKSESKSGVSDNVTVSEKNIIGKWVLQTIYTDGETIKDGAQIWDFKEDHHIYVSQEGLNDYVDGGVWSLEGKTLTTQFIPIPVTVSQLTSTKLVLEASYGGQLVFRYTFNKKK